jgi:lipid-A-disaccharide synthase-like uncharacterized protein
VGRALPLQWWLSEREGTSRFPPVFWWTSLTGNLLLLGYALHIRDLLFVAAYLPCRSSARKLVVDKRRV